MPRSNKFYVTTPIYYVNSKPHLGTLYSTILADVTARWNKLCGKKVFFLTGTDEHGQKLEESAAKAGIEVSKFVDSMIPYYKTTWQLYNIEYDKFIRTTDIEHKNAVNFLIKKLQEQDDIYKSEYSGLYCVPCETFVTIGSEAIKDESGKYFCPSCKRELKEITEESYFFRLSAYEDRLLKFYEENPNFIEPEEKLNEIISFVKSGLKDLSISRKKVKWGIPFPGNPEHTVYVWCDALTNYISAIGFGNNSEQAKQNFDFWWPCNLHIMGKDIFKFHAIYWPAFLISAGLALPKKLLVHGYILVDGKKMSKSLGNSVDPVELAKTYGADQVRYYLLRQMPINQDGNFSLKDLESRIASDLANNLGNLLNRTITLALNNNFEKINKQIDWMAESLALKEKCEEVFRSFWDEMLHNHYHIALSLLWNFISQVNAYFHAQQPWVVVKKDKELFEEIISVTCHSLYSIAIMLWPIMPKKMEELLNYLGYKFDLKNNYEEELRKNLWNKNFNLIKPEQQLFVRPELKEELELNSKKETNFINIDEFLKVNLYVGTITECESVKGSNRLYRLLVDFGELGKRQILSGVAQFFKPEELIGKQGVFVTNLEPRSLMGFESQGMMLFAKDNAGNMRMITVSGWVTNGTKLS